MTSFQHYIGIDWSGAKGSGPTGRTNSLQVACCGQGRKAPSLSRTQTKIATNWNRWEIVELLVKEAGKGPALIGFDFAFAYPFSETGGYFPGLDESPAGVRQLWAKVEENCRDDDTFYGAGFFDSPASPFAPYFHCEGSRAEPCDLQRWRMTETACRAVGANPHSTFKCIGAGQVGRGSVAGMRVLHRLTTKHPDLFAVWPFDGVGDGSADALEAGRSVIVEVFPTLFFAQSESGRGKTVEEQRRAFEHFHSEAPADLDGNQDKADALVTAAALRHYAVMPGAFVTKRMGERARSREGWIFGAVA